MEILILPILGILMYGVIFYKPKTNIEDLRKSLKKLKTEDLKMASFMIQEELDKRLKT